MQIFSRMLHIRPLKDGGLLETGMTKGKDMLEGIVFQKPLGMTVRRFVCFDTMI